MDSLIKVSKELAQVGSDIEAVTKEQANLEHRVATQLLTVEINSRGTRSFGRPIADAVGDFGENLSEGIAIAVTGVAYLLPWVLLLTIVFWLGRKVWRRMRKKPA